MPRGPKLRDNHRKNLLLLIAEGSLALLAAASTGSPIRTSRTIKGFSSEIIQELRERKGKKLWELAQRKLIKMRLEDDGSTTVELTHQGRILVRRYKLEDMHLEKPQVWDKKWRIISYDIPVKRKKASQALSKKLHQLGLYQFQRSVWFSPYECLSELEFICQIFELEIDKHIFYFMAQAIPKEDEVKEFFALR